jgi:hypothetical protein
LQYMWQQNFCNSFNNQVSTTNAMAHPNFMQQLFMGSKQLHKLVTKFPDFYGIQRFTTVFKRGYHMSLSWVRWIQSIAPHIIHLPSTLTLTANKFKRSLVFVYIYI